MTVEIVVMLQRARTRVDAVHERAWWPNTGATRHSRVGGNNTRTASPALTVGDGPSYERWKNFITDLNGLRGEVHRLAGLPPPRQKLDEWVHPLRVRTVLTSTIEHLVYRPTPLTDDEVESLSARCMRLQSHQEAILSVPRVGTTIRCKNAGERDLCTGWASNQRQQLCRSCENHEYYLNRRRRRTRTGGTS